MACPPEQTRRPGMVGAKIPSKMKDYAESKLYFGVSAPDV
jgi:hypothetical protein